MFCSVVPRDISFFGVQVIIRIKLIFDIELALENEMLRTMAVLPNLIKR